MIINKDNKDDAERYIGSVVMFNDDVSYSVLLLRIYEDGFLTSAGFTEELIVPDKPLAIDDSDELVLFHAVAATELPVSMFKRKYVFANESTILEDVDVFLMCASLSGGDTLDVVQSMKDIDINAAYKIATDDKPNVPEVDIDESHRVFQSSKGYWYSWCMMLPVNYLIKN